MRRVSHTILGRADLLRLRAAGVALDVHVTELFGYAIRDAEPDVEPSIALPEPPAPEPDVSSDARELLPDRPGPEDPVFHVVDALIETRDLSTSASNTDDPVGRNRSSPLERQRARPAPFLPAMSREVCRERIETMIADHRESRRLDVPVAVRRLSRAAPVGDWPRRSRRGVAGGIIVLVDTRSCLMPLHDDYELVASEIVCHWGQDLATRLYLPDGPMGRWWAVGVRPEWTPERLPPESRIVLLSDLVPPEQVLGQSRSLRHLMRTLRDQGHEVHRWGFEFDRPRAEVVDYLVTAMSRCHFPSTRQLRALRMALDTLGIRTSLADELAVWNHPERDSRLEAAWRLRGRNHARRLERYRELPDEVRAIFERILQRYRRTFADDTACVEQMLGVRAGVEGKPDARWLNDSIRRVEEGGDLAEAWWCHVSPVLETVYPAFETDPSFQAAYETAQRIAYRYGLAQPSGHRFMPGEASSVELALVQVGDEAALVRHAGHHPVFYRSHGPWLDHDTGAALHEGLIDMTAGRRRIRLPECRFELLAMTRPDWATEIWREPEGLFLRHESRTTFARLPSRSDTDAPKYAVIENGLDWAREVGVDRYGVWAELAVNDATHRLRWIPPGEFLMGSPPKESERSDRETQHRVTLTRGYWLGETACPQRLWEAVTGGNPSHSKGADRPVEKVSWEDVQGFAERLNERLPDLHARLPTEAEWEYAARAGTKTPFWWGEELTTERANYDGNHPYAGGEKGEYREETVEVKLFEANPWGLYQVHGNVYEWCADRYGEYGEGVAVDPRGPAAGVARVCRGGSWDARGRWLRAAYRSGIVRVPPGYRAVRLGFRLAAGQFPGAEP